MTHPARDPRSPASRVVDTLVVTTYPRPVALRWAATLRQTNPDRIARHARHALELTLRAALAVALADARSPDDALITALRASLARPSLGLYARALNCVAERLRGPAAFVPEVAAWLARGGAGARGAWEEIDGALATRNADEHLHAPPEDDAEAWARASRLVTRARQVLDELAWLGRYRLAACLGAEGPARARRTRLALLAGAGDPETADVVLAGSLVPGDTVILSPDGARALVTSPFLHAADTRTVVVLKSLRGDALVCTDEAERAGPAATLSGALAPGRRALALTHGHARSPLALPLDPHPPGSSLDGGRLRVVGRLGDGAMGAVLLVRDSDDGEWAVKVMRAPLAADEALRERFRREAAALESLYHPHVVPLLQHGVLDDGSPFVRMPVLRRGSLEDALAEGPIDEPRALRWGAELLSALAHVHARGLVHRDVKPANLLLGDDDRVLLSDFGVLRLPGSTLTGPLERLGSRGYSAPEQEDPAAVTDRADVYGAAAVIHCLLRGSPPKRPGEGLRRGRVATLLRAMGDPDPARRPSAAEAEARLRELCEAAERQRAEAARREALAAAPAVQPGAAPAAQPGAAPAPMVTPTALPAQPALAPAAAHHGGRSDAAHSVTGASSRRPPMVLVRVEPGHFTLGSPLDEPGRLPDEGPVAVTLTRPIALLAAPVTEALIADVLRRPTAPDRPATARTWFEAAAFCNALSGAWSLPPAYRVEQGRLLWDRASTGLRLPTEAEWERACRSGALVDMLGAVWQWCWDWYAPYGGGADPAGPEAGTLRVVRGGSGDMARIAWRYAVPPDTRHPEITFRVCRTLPPGA